MVTIRTQEWDYKLDSYFRSQSELVLNDWHAEVIPRYRNQECELSPISPNGDKHRYNTHDDEVDGSDRSRRNTLYNLSNAHEYTTPESVHSPHTDQMDASCVNYS